MKHIFNILLLISGILFTSCNKYPDGPSFSLETKKSRVANVWMVDKFFINGNDETAHYRSLVRKETLVFFKGGTFQYSELTNWSWAIPNYDGKWNLIHSKQDLEMIPDNPAVEYKLFKILRLKNDELWLQREVRPDSVVQFHLVPQISN